MNWMLRSAACDGRTGGRARTSRSKITSPNSSGGGRSGSAGERPSVGPEGRGGDSAYSSLSPKDNTGPEIHHHYLGRRDLGLHYPLVFVDCAGHRSGRGGYLCHSRGGRAMAGLYDGLRYNHRCHAARGDEEAGPGPEAPAAVISVRCRVGGRFRYRSLLGETMRRCRSCRRLCGVMFPVGLDTTLDTKFRDGLKG